MKVKFYIIRNVFFFILIFLLFILAILKKNIIFLMIALIFIVILYVIEILKHKGKIRKIGLICYDTQYEQINNLLKRDNIICSRITLAKNGGPIKKIVKFISIITKYDIIYYGYGVSKFPWQIVIAKIFGKKIVMHWIGTDVLGLYNSKFKFILNICVNLHLACSKKICDELKINGIVADVIPIVPIDMNFSISKVPQKHGILFYLPDNREEFYGLKFLKFLVKKFPNNDYYVVGNKNYDFSFAKNIHNLGKLSLKDMDSLYDKISILVRIPEHDGLSMMLLEALMRGKNVIYCYDFPYAVKAINLVELERAFSKIVNSKPLLNKGSREFILKEYEVSKIKNELFMLLEKNKII